MTVVTQNHFSKFVMLYLLFSITASAADRAVEKDPQQTVSLVSSVPSRLSPPEEFLNAQRQMIAGKKLTVEAVLLSSTWGLRNELLLLPFTRYGHAGLSLRADTGETFSFEVEVTTKAQQAQGILTQAQIRPLEPVIARYKGYVTKRDIVQNAEDKPDVSELVHKYLGTPCEDRPTQLLKTTIRSHEDNDFTKLTCSGLVALVLQEAGYLPRDYSFKNFHPWDFSEGIGGVKLQNARLDKEILVKDYTAPSLDFLEQISQIMSLE